LTAVEAVVAVVEEAVVEVGAVVGGVVVVARWTWSDRGGRDTGYHTATGG